MVPGIFRELPEKLTITNASATDQDVELAAAVRRRFEMEEYPNPYMVDIIRAFRLVDNASVYIEVGTRDKGNLAWVAPKLAPSGLMVDVDLEQFDDAEKKLRKEIGSLQYARIIGDSIAPTTVADVKKALNGRRADVIFCDSSHMYNHTMSEFDLYFPLVKPGGALMFHDCFWEGNDHDKGKCQALSMIDKYIPVYCIHMNEPTHRFLPRSENQSIWGGVAIILKA